MSQSILREFVDFSIVENEIIVEENTGKSYFISGIFMQANVKNKNNRVYPRPVLEHQVGSYQDKINNRQSMGELGHPENLEINLPNVSHLITELNFISDNDCVGKALVLDTPNGKIAKALMDQKIKLGVSSRGAGTLKEQIVQNDYILRTVDIVSDPSAPNAFVEGILESRTEWVLENNILTEREITELKNDLDKEASKVTHNTQDAILKVFEKALSLTNK